MLGCARLIKYTLVNEWAVGIDGNTVALQASIPGSIPGRSTINSVSCYKADDGNLKQSEVWLPSMRIAVQVVRMFILV